MLILSGNLFEGKHLSKQVFRTWEKTMEKKDQGARVCGTRMFYRSSSWSSYKIQGLNWLHNLQYIYILYMHYVYTYYTFKKKKYIYIYIQYTHGWICPYFTNLDISQNQGRLYTKTTVGVTSSCACRTCGPGSAATVEPLHSRTAAGFPSPLTGTSTQVNDHMAFNGISPMFQ